MVVYNIYIVFSGIEKEMKMRSYHSYRFKITNFYFTYMTKNNIHYCYRHKEPCLISFDLKLGRYQFCFSRIGKKIHLTFKLENHESK